MHHDERWLKIADGNDYHYIDPRSSTAGVYQESVIIMIEPVVELATPLRTGALECRKRIDGRTIFDWR